MSDLRPVLERLRTDLVPPTDPAAGFRSLDALRRRRSIRRRVAAGCVACVVAVAGVGAVAMAFRGDPPRERTPAAVGWSSFDRGWTELPMNGMTGSAWAWTGSELIVWGGSPNGSPEPSPSGARFDPATSTWQPIPDAPQGGMDAEAVWTGTEILFWGGWAAEGERLDGLAFDPASNLWRRIPEAPLRAGATAVTVWTGTEMIVWGGGEQDAIRTHEGAAYDPASDSWRKLARAPIGLNLADGVWTGSEMVVFGSLLDRRNYASTKTAIGARYDPASDNWTELPPSDLSPQATALGLLGDELVAYDYGVRSQTFELSIGRWTEPTKMPLRSGECYPDIAVLPDLAFAFYCGQAATLVPGGDWQPTSGGMLDATYEVDGNSYQLYRFATTVQVDDGIVFAVEGITQEGGQVCYGCPGAPRALWLWRP